MATAYTDGAEQEVLRLLASAPDLSSMSLVAHERYSEWPIRYHLCPERSNLLRHLDFAGLDVLDLGAGMGGASRVMAESARTFTAVELTESRAAALRSRLRDLKDWEVHVADIQSFETDRRFDVVSLIGVLEYAELHLKPPSGCSPFEWMLARASSFLRHGGCVIVAIENRNGIKYWAGAPEDHTGRMFDGICGYGTEKTARTFSRKTLLEHFKAVGLHKVAEYYPWPDYKTPSSVIAKALIDRSPFLAADIAADATAHEDLQRSTYFPWTLALREVSRSGLLAEMANSFLFVGSEDDASPVRAKLLSSDAAAWHYAINRRDPIRTEFLLQAAGDGTPAVRKTRLSAAEPPAYRYVAWSTSPSQPALLGRTVLMKLRQCGFADDGEGFRSTLLQFIRWVLETKSLDAEHVSPEAFDLVPSNAVEEAGNYLGFDLEWSLKRPLDKSWFVLRNLLVVRDALSLFSTPPYPTFAAFYDSLCADCGIQGDVARDIEFEAEVQSDIQRNVSSESARDSLRTIFLDPWRPAAYPRDLETSKRLRGIASGPPSFGKRLGRLIRSPRALILAVGGRAKRLLKS